jgi:hypothetical protein
VKANSYAPSRILKFLGDGYWDCIYRPHNCRWFTVVVVVVIVVVVDIVVEPLFGVQK